MAGLQQTYLFFCTGTHTCGQGLKDWDLLHEQMKTQVKTKRIKGSVFCDQSIDAKIVEPSFFSCHCRKHSITQEPLCL